jgi:hypothetical protein
MNTVSSVGAANKIAGPSGFIEISGQMLVVDYGKIYHEGSPAGFLFEDGLLKGIAGLKNPDELKPIDEIPGCIFRGIDTNGMALELPGNTRGPTGLLTYNGLSLTVVNGRIATHDHFLVGEFDDEGNVYVRDTVKKVALRKLDEHTQLATEFKGRKSNGSNWHHEFSRPLYKKDRKHFENEIVRYFENFEGLTSPQKKYVIESLRIWSKSGLLQIVRKSEGNAALGNVKHGASGVTGVRTGMVTLDREEFEKEITLSKRFGALAVVATRIKPFVEVRLNQVVSHEYGHQLEFIMSQATQERMKDLYKKRLARSEKQFPLPADYEGQSELVTPQQVTNRVFISGYARSSEHEYWAECTAAFSVRESREVLKETDHDMYQLMHDVLFKPEQTIRPVFVDTILDLQASLRLGGEFSDDLLNT